MSRIARLAVVLACLVMAGCDLGSTAPSPAPGPVPAPGSPAPQPPLQTFTLSGIVKEAWIDTGLPGVSVTIASGPTRGSTTTDEEGRYAFSGLPPGTYQLTYSKPTRYPAQSSGPLNVFEDITYTIAMSMSSPVPVTAADLTGYWVGQGPYPNEPCWLLITQNGTRLEGWYKDRRDYSTTMSGTYAGGAVFLRVGGTGLTIEGRLEDARCMRAVIKNEALGGNFPIEVSRGGSCAR